jgi:hypothetical protein
MRDFKKWLGYTLAAITIGGLLMLPFLIKGYDFLTSLTCAVIVAVFFAAAIAWGWLISWLIEG